MLLVDYRKVWQGIPLLFLIFVACLLSHPSLNGAGNEVVIVANADSPDSVRIARHYQKARKIPDAQVILLPLSGETVIPFQAFVDTLQNPLLRELSDRNLIDASFAENLDSFGRIQPKVESMSFRYIVLIRGVPVRVEEPEATPDESFIEEWPGLGNLAQQFVEGPFARAEGSVDGFLGLMMFPQVPLRGFIPNPFRARDDTAAAFLVPRITRLDGPEVRHVIGMIDDAIETEKVGLQGRAYVDLDTRDGGYALGNEWLGNAEAVFRSLNYPLSVERNSTPFQATDRMDQAALYAGWYAHHVEGPFALPGFRLAEGSIAVHLHSFSAADLRNASKRWCGPLIASGAAATLGNTAEPYLTLTHDLGAFFDALSRGWTFGDAAYFALPALGWQAVAIGDPLYRPFLQDIETQAAKIGKDPGRMLEDSYLALRMMEKSIADGKPEDALSIARRAALNTPGPAILLKLAELEAEKNPAAAIRQLDILRHFDAGDSSLWGLMLEAARQYQALGKEKKAFTIVNNLMKKKLPSSFRKELSPFAIESAEKAGEWNSARQWRSWLNSATGE